MYPVWWHDHISKPLLRMGKRTLIIYCLKRSLQHFFIFFFHGACAKQWQGQTLEFSIALKSRPHKCMYFSISYATKRQEFICALLKASPWWGIPVGGNKVSICTAWHSPQCRNGCICDKYTRQTNCSKAGGEPADAMHDLVFTRHKPSLNSTVLRFSFTPPLWDGQRERFREEGLTEAKRKRRHGRRIEKPESTGRGSNTAPNEILLNHQSKASAPSAQVVLTMW